MSQSRYSYSVDTKASLRTFAQAAVLATLRSASDNEVHFLAIKARDGGSLISENGVHAAIRAGGIVHRTFNFTGLCAAYFADGHRFTRLESACARALTRAQATRALCTVVCMGHDKERIATIEIEAFAQG